MQEDVAEVLDRLLVLCARMPGRRDVLSENTHLKEGIKEEILGAILGKRNTDHTASDIPDFDTLGTLARWLVQNANQIYWPLIEMSKVEHTSSLPLLICFHPISGVGTTFFQLARELRGDFVVYGVQARRLNPGETPHASLKAVSAAYVASIEKIYDGQPIYLLGWSYGGLIAKEFARELGDRNIVTDKLIALDSFVAKDIISERERLSLSFRDWVCMHFEEFGIMLPNGFFQMNADQQARSYFSTMLDYGAVRPIMVKQPVSRLKRVIKTTYSFYSIYRSHKPQKHDITTLLIKAYDNDKLGIDPVTQWLGFTRDLTVHDFDEAHLDMVEKPEAARKLAPIIRDFCCDNV